MAYLTTTTATGSSFGERMNTIFQSIATRVKQYRLYRETFDGLSALSDRDLADLGLHRSNLQQVATESARDAVK